MKYQIKNITQIPIEGTHDLQNSRQTLVTASDVLTNNLDAMTKGILPAGKIWDWHSHEEYDELCIVIKGFGTFYWEDVEDKYSTNNVIIIPANSNHKIVAMEDSEFYFCKN